MRKAFTVFTSASLTRNVAFSARQRHGQLRAFGGIPSQSTDERRATIARLTKERDAALAARARCDAALAGWEASEKQGFFARMRAISLSAGTFTNAEVRRGTLPVLASIDDVLRGIPPASDGGRAAIASWDSFCVAHDATWAPPSNPQNLDESRDIRPIVVKLLAAAAPRRLRIWSGAAAPDDVAHSPINPDCFLTEARDSTPSMIGAKIIVEVVLIGNMVHALRQTRVFLRRRVYKLCCEREARGEPFDDVFALGVATDGTHVALVRVDSGAPPAGQSFKNTVPCPVLETKAMEALTWDFASPRSFQGTPPPEGFIALVRLCGAPSALLAEGSPLSTLHVSVRSLVPSSSDATGAATGGVSSDAVLRFGARLGCGSFSDVYEVGSAVTAAGATVPYLDGCVAKVARVATVEACDTYAAEHSALETLRPAAALGLVPDLVGVGCRKAESIWPVLLMRPRGLPVQEWVSQRVAAAAAAAGAVPADRVAAASAARIACAKSVVLRLLDALDAAHACRLAHCDVRPANVVIFNGAAVLIDWGSSCNLGESSVARGVPAYASARVFEQGSCVAHPAQDVAGALYTWLSVAFGADCVAPWVVSLGILRSDSAMYDARDKWISARGNTDAAVAAVAKVLLTTEGRVLAADANPVHLFAAARSAVELLS